jgi:hypothetical protein
VVEQGVDHGVVEHRAFVGRQGDSLDLDEGPQQVAKPAVRRFVGAHGREMREGHGVLDGAGACVEVGPLHVREHLLYLRVFPRHDDVGEGEDDEDQRTAGRRVSFVCCCRRRQHQSAVGVMSTMV